MPAPRVRSSSQLLEDILEQAFSRRSWHGTNLCGALRGVGSRVATWRPVPGRHNLWEIALHCAYWKYAVWRRLAGEKRGSFPIPGSNWFSRPQFPNVEPAAAAWRNEVRLLHEMHERLMGAVRSFPAQRWQRAAPGSRFRYFDLVAGVAAHDLYHTGQIQLLKRLAPKEEP